MKLILTQDVSGLGAPGDVVEVKDGYGRNYLLPRGLATAWTKGGEKQVAQIKRAREVREVRDLGHANEIKQALEALTITMPAHAGDTGRLFGSITNADIAEAAAQAAATSRGVAAATCATTSSLLGSTTRCASLPSASMFCVALAIVFSAFGPHTPMVHSELDMSVKVTEPSVGM